MSVPTWVGVDTVVVLEPETIIELGFEPHPQMVPSDFIAKEVSFGPVAMSIQSVSVPICMGIGWFKVAGALPVW